MVSSVCDRAGVGGHAGRRKDEGAAGQTGSTRSPSLNLAFSDLWMPKLQ